MMDPSVTTHGASLSCLAGTLIQTPVDAIPAEALVVGEMVMLASGTVGRISAVSHTSLSGPHLQSDSAQLPVMIRAGAIARGAPRRDLFVMPHAEIARDDWVKPLIGILDERQILQIQAANRLDIVTLSVDEAGFMVAEGLAIRAASAQSGGLAQRARTLPATIHAVIETCNRNVLSGRATDSTEPGRPVRLQIYIDGIAAGDTVADLPLDDGSAAFKAYLPGALGSRLHTLVHVQLAQSDFEIDNSPFLLSRATALPAHLPHSMMMKGPTPGFTGQLGIVTRTRIEGFAWEPSQPNTPVSLLILDNGQVIAPVLANLSRSDLLANGIGDGRHGFDLRIPGGLSPLETHVIQVVREADGAEFNGPPVVLPASGAFTELGKKAVVEAGAALSTVQETEQAVTFLLGETSRLLQQRADLDGQRESRAAFMELRRRWGPKLDALGLDPASVPGKRALVVVDHLPRTKRPYASAQLVSHVAALSALGFQVSVAPAEEMSKPAEAAQRAALGDAILCGAPFYGSAEEVLRRQAACFDVIIVFGVFEASLYLRLARRLHPKARLVFNPVHLAHLELSDRAAVEGRPELVNYSNARRYDEAVATSLADVVTTTSPFEEAAIARLVAKARVAIVPFAVPARLTQQSTVSESPGSRSGVAMLAGRGDDLDDDAAYHLVTTVMPLIWQKQPGILCYIVFADIPQWSMALSRPGVVVCARDDETGRSILDRVMLTVAPYRYHVGLNAALLESLGAGVPCLMLPAASDGIALPADLALLACADDQALADQVVALHGDGPAYERTVDQVGRFIGRTFSQDRVAEALDIAISGGLGARPIARGAAQP